MSKLEELIAALCPDGVEYKELNEIGIMVRGNGLQKKDFTDGGVGCIHYGQIYTYYKNFADETKSFVSLENAKKLKKVTCGDLIIAITSENTEDVCKCVAWLGDNEIVTGGHTAIFKHNQDSKYLVYCLQTEEFFAQKKKIVSGTKVIEVSTKKLEKVKIPLPPLEIQREIVRILDNFTELTAELTARKKQYEYYRDLLLLLNNDTNLGERKNSEIEWVKLNVIAKYSDSKIEAINVDKKSYVGVDNLLPNRAGKTISSYVPVEGRLSYFKSGDILIGNIRPYLKKIWFATHQGGTNGDVLVIQVRDSEKVLPKYLFHILSTDNFFLYNVQNSRGAKMPRGNKSAIMDYSIPVPKTTEVQQQIVNILDRFDALCNDITIGLPAEIEARQKQYEYYRDKLLTFKEKQV